MRNSNTFSRRAIRTITGLLWIGSIVFWVIAQLTRSWVLEGSWRHWLPSEFTASLEQRVPGLVLVLDLNNGVTTIFVSGAALLLVWGCTVLFCRSLANTASQTNSLGYKRLVILQYYVYAALISIYTLTALI